MLKVTDIKKATVTGSVTVDKTILLKFNYLISLLKEIKKLGLYIADCKELSVELRIYL